MAYIDPAKDGIKMNFIKLSLLLAGIATIIHNQESNKAELVSLITNEHEKSAVTMVEIANIKKDIQGISDWRKEMTLFFYPDHKFSLRKTN